MPNALIVDALGGQGKVVAFFRAKLLEWFECLSLLDQLPRGLEALRTLADASKPGSSLSVLVQDATRFLLQHYYTIATWPLQIYSSAIVFSPQTSVVRVANLDNIPRWLKALPQVKATWTSLVQTLRGHSNSVTAVAFSPDSKHIASGSWDNTIKLWDATTGDYKKTLEGHSDLVSAVAFSPDGKQIASGSDDKTLKLWDIGKVLRSSKFFGNTLNSHFKCRSKREIRTSRAVTALKYSADGRKIMSNVGLLTVDSVASGTQHCCGSTLLDDIWVDDTWLCCGAMRLLQLASDCEPNSYDTSGDQAAVGMSNGLVLAFGIDRKRLNVALRNSCRDVQDCMT